MALPYRHDGYKVWRLDEGTARLGPTSGIYINREIGYRRGAVLSPDYPDAVLVDFRAAR
jgi:hypothetical protein